MQVPGGEGVSYGGASAPPRAGASVGGLSWPSSDPVVVAGPAQTSAATGPGAGPKASASASVSGVELFGGQITVGRAELHANASATGDGASGGLGGSTASGVTVLGQAVAAVPNTSVALGDWGHAVVLEQAVVNEAGAYRGFVVGLHVTLTAAHGGLPAGTEILVGYAEAAAQAPPSPAPPPPEQPSGGSSGGDGSSGSDGDGAGSSGDGDGDGTSGDGGGGASIPKEPTEPPPGARPSEPPAIVRDPPPGVQPQITGAGYVFPVYGAASFSDDFAAARATTGWHHGNDIFAPLGAPILAVADGTLFSVGWNGVGGHRLWLRDRQGNEYYYAHLSAFSPLAENGAQVEAGDVLGFVGTSGDAQGTPPHLHFEIHPAGLLGLGYDGVVNPYPYLVAWYARRDAGEISADVPVSVPQAPSAVVGWQDISAASGIVPGAVEEAWAAPLLLGEATGLTLPPERPQLVGRDPGF